MAAMLGGEASACTADCTGPPGRQAQGTAARWECGGQTSWGFLRLELGEREPRTHVDGGSQIGLDRGPAHVVAGVEPLFQAHLRDARFERRGRA